MDLYIIVWLFFTVITVIYYRHKLKKYPSGFGWITLLLLAAGIFGGIYYFFWAIDKNFIEPYIALPLPINVVILIGGVSILVLAWEELMKLTKTKEDVE